MSQRSVRSIGQLQAKSIPGITEEVPAPHPVRDAVAAQVLTLPAADPLHLPHPQPPLAVPHIPPLPRERGDAVVPSPVGLAGAAEVAALTDISRTIRAETGDGAAVPAAQSTPLVTGSAAVRDSADLAGAAGAGPRPVAAAAETGGAAEITDAAEVVVRAVADENKKVPAGTEREGKRGVGATRRIRRGKTKM